jgi:hypothetical protein
MQPSLRVRKWNPPKIGELSKRQLAFCHSSNPSDYHDMLNSCFPCKVMYSKEHEHGTLYAIVLTKATAHKTLDNRIAVLNSTLMQIGGGSTSATRFTSISQVLGGKIKTFGAGKHMFDVHYKAIFSSNNPGGGREWIVQPDVLQWIPPPSTREAVQRLQTVTHDEEFEFDVVKKRRVMDSAPPSPSSDDTPAALDAFENFERCVLPALELIRSNDEQERKTEIEELEDSMAKGIILSPTGGVYFAWSECLRCMKIGATRRSNPITRLQELSCYVTTPFTLVGWIPTPTPFRLESLAHSHFAAARIRHAGAGTEFFNINSTDAASYCSAAAIASQAE